MIQRAYVFALLLLVAVASALGQDTPQRIVSTVPALTEMLFAVGAGAQVVGVTSFCVYPVEAQQIDKVGGYADLSFEKLLSLKPDLVLMAEYGRQLRQRCEAARLPSLAVKTTTVDDILSTIETIGTATGHKDKGREVVNTIKQSLDRLRHESSLKPARRTLIVIGRSIGSFQGLLAVGPGGFLDDLLTMAGGTNVLADVGQPWPQIGIETVLTRRPDTIIELIDDRSHTGITDQEVAHRKADWKRFSSLPAVENERIHILRSDHALIPGPRITDTAAGLAEMLR